MTAFSGETLGGASGKVWCVWRLPNLSAPFREASHFHVERTFEAET